MADSYFVRPDPDGPALNIKPGFQGSETASSKVLISTGQFVGETPVVLDQSRVEEVCRTMYRMAGLEWWPDQVTAEEPTEKKVIGFLSSALKGAHIDDLIKDLFLRVERLEQTSAGGAAVDDMFAEQSRRIDELGRAGERLGDIVNLLEEIRDRLPSPPPPAGM
jgi:hypothetical protein